MLSPLWNHHVTLGGSPASSTVYMRIMEQLGFFTALGVVIVFVAATALGRIASVTSGIRPVEEIPETTVPADTVPVDRVTDEPLPVRNRTEFVPTAHASTAETRDLPAHDTTGTIGSGTIQ